MHPHPVKQPNLTRKFPLTDMPTGLMAALVTRLADRLPIGLQIFLWEGALLHVTRPRAIHRF